MAEKSETKQTVKVKKRKPNFQRTKFRAYVKLGKNQKSKRKYRKATGIHNKIREKRKGRPKRVEIGYKNDNSIRNLIQGKVPVMISTLADLKKVKKNEIIIFAKIGAKKKLEIIKEIEKQGLEILNLNIKKFKRQQERKTKAKKASDAEKKAKDKAKKGDKKKEDKKDKDNKTEGKQEEQTEKVKKDKETKQ
jgi:ribosomal protein L32E